jgi:hypothetical protein
MRHIPHATRIFIGVIIITFLLTCVALYLSAYQQRIAQNETMSPVDEIHQNIPNIDTSDWQSYQDKAYPISFRFPKEWKVSAGDNQLGFYDIDIIKGEGHQDMHFYISSSDYYGLATFDHTPHMVGTRKGFQAAKNLVGIKVGEYYYTFDGSYEAEQADEFDAILNSVTFQ